MKRFLFALLLFIFAIEAHEFDFSELVKSQSESVVNIQSVRKVKLSQRSLNSSPRMSKIFKLLKFSNFLNVKNKRVSKRAQGT